MTDKWQQNPVKERIRLRLSKIGIRFSDMSDDIHNKYWVKYGECFVDRRDVQKALNVITIAVPLYSEPSE